MTPLVAAVLGGLLVLAAPRPAAALDPQMLMLAPPGQPVPAFALPAVDGRSRGLGAEHLHGEVSLVNVFASWCGPCRDEHPLLMDLARRRAVAVHGLNYKDRPEDARRWLDRLGDPYDRTGADRDGRVAEAMGLFGLPQTFVIDGDGRIAYRHVGVLSRAALDETILPLVTRLGLTAR